MGTTNQDGSCTNAQNKALNRPPQMLRALLLITSTVLKFPTKYADWMDDWLLALCAGFLQLFVNSRLDDKEYFIYWFTPLHYCAGTTNWLPPTCSQNVSSSHAASSKVHLHSTDDPRPDIITGSPARTCNAAVVVQVQTISSADSLGCVSSKERLQCACSRLRTILRTFTARMQ
jgi:hypothetical protein